MEVGEGTGVEVLTAVGAGGISAAGVGVGIAGIEERSLHPKIKAVAIKAITMDVSPRKDMKSGSDDLNSPATFIGPKNSIWRTACNGRRMKA